MTYDLKALDLLCVNVFVGVDVAVGKGWDANSYTIPRNDWKDAKQLMAK